MHQTRGRPQPDRGRPLSAVQDLCATPAGSVWQRGLVRHHGVVDEIAVDLVVTGQVQGVFFRASMREQAERLGVAGWVRNEPDGSVHAHLEGPGDAVEALAAWCEDGPTRARVEEVRRSPATRTGAESFDAG